MSYLVLARKYRPKTFDEFVGQDAIAETLRNAIRLDRVAHAYLFCGPRGVGKTSMARVFAKALNCEKGPTVEPCGRCNLCVAIDSGQDVDVIEIDGASNRKLDDVREIRQNVRYAASRSRFKIYYIDEVHMLITEAFNALLKTLEEPPAHVKFIFSTTAAAKLPETILSRVQRFDFRRVSNTDIAALLAKICKGEGIAAPDEVLLLVARKARGSVRDALSLLDQIISFCGEKPEPDAVAAFLGALGDDELARLLGMIREKDTGGLIRATGELVDRGLDIIEVMDQLIAYFRDLLVARVCGADSNLLDRPADSAAAIVVVAREVSPEQILYMVQLLNEGRRRVREGQDGRLVLEISLIKLAQSDGLAPVGEMLERLAALEDTIEESGPGGSESPAQGRPIVPPATKTTSLFESGRGSADETVRESKPRYQGESSPGRAATRHAPPSEKKDESRAPRGSADLWSRLLELTHEKNGWLHVQLGSARLQTQGDQELVVAFPANRSSAREEAEKPENRRLFEKIASNLLGHPIRVRFVSETEEKRAEAPAQGVAVQDEIVQEAIHIFDGRQEKGG